MNILRVIAEIAAWTAGILLAALVLVGLSILVSVFT